MTIIKTNRARALDVLGTIGINKELEREGALTGLDFNEQGDRIIEDTDYAFYNIYGFEPRITIEDDQVTLEVAIGNGNIAQLEKIVGSLAKLKELIKEDMDMKFEAYIGIVIR